MSKIIVDEIQKNGGVPLKIPSTDGTVGQVIKTDGSGQLGFVDQPVIPADTVVPPDSDNSIGWVYSSSARSNVYSTGEWTSSGPNSTYYNNLQDASARLQAVNMALGDGYPDGTSQNFYVGDCGEQKHRELMFAPNKRLGHRYSDRFYYDNASTDQTYAGITVSLMPIRNSSSAAIDVTMDTYTSCGSNNYGGSGMAVYTPVPGVYSVAGATAGAWTTLWSYTSTNNAYNKTQVVSVPANSTVIVMLTSAHIYHTTYRFKDTHFYRNLHTTFSDPAIKCDLRMLYTLQMGKRPSATYNTDTTQELWTSCADLFGDR